MMQVFKNLKFSLYIVPTILMLLNLCVIDIFRHGSVVLILIYVSTLIIGNRNQSLFKNLCIHIDVKIIASLALFILWIAMSSFWSYDSKVSVKTFLIACLLVSMILTFICALQNQTYFKPQHIIKFIMVTVILTGIILLIQQYFLNVGYNTIYQVLEHKWRSLKPNSELICILSIPAFISLIMRKNFIWAMVFFISALYFAHYLEIKATYYGFILAVPAALISLINRRFIHYLMKIFTTLYIITLPFIFNCFDKIDFSQYLKNNFSYYTLFHRIYIWDYIRNLIQQKPFLGWGGGISASYSKTVHHFAYSDWSVFPSHPHNVFMQIWFETGLVGTLVTACFFWRWLDLIWKYNNPLHRGAHIFYFVHTLAILSLSHSLWHSWWISWIAFGWVLTQYIIKQDQLNAVSSKI